MPGAPPPSFLIRALRLGPADLAAAGVAVFELARSRMRLRQLDPAEFPALGARVASPTARERALIERISLAITRVAPRLPWRADCLVRAEAARHWLKRKGLAAEIRLGARKTRGGQLEAHAWLICKGCLVTGGDVSEYTPFA